MNERIGDIWMLSLSVKSRPANDTPARQAGAFVFCRTTKHKQKTKIDIFCQRTKENINFENYKLR
jgi:hypothetical protein